MFGNDLPIPLQLGERAEVSRSPSYEPEPVPQELPLSSVELPEPQPEEVEPSSSSSDSGSDISSDEFFDADAELDSWSTVSGLSCVTGVVCLV